MYRDFRTVSFRILTDVFKNKRWAKDSIEANMKDLDAAHKDINKVYELVYGVMRRKNLIDYLLSRFIQRPNNDYKVQNILRIGFYQINYMNSIPPYAAIDRCVELAKEYVHPKTAGFINGVLRNVIRNKDDKVKIHAKNNTEYLSIKHSYEKWMVNFFIKHYGKEKAGRILKAGNERPPVFIRSNNLKFKTSNLKLMLKKEGVDAEQVKLVKDAYVVTSGSPIKTEAHEKGMFYIQDLSSQILGSFIAAKQKDAIFDIGAAPGGKSAYMSIDMKNKGQIMAIEPQKERITKMEQNFVRLGITNVEIIAHDATVDIPAFHNRADKILIDAPCSALGTIRRHPEKKWCMSEPELKEFPKLQLKILNTAAAWVKKGGELYYSTCTINPDENEKVIEKFIKKNTGFKVSDICGKTVKFKEFRQGKYFLSLPGNKANMDGFFIAKLVRK